MTDITTEQTHTSTADSSSVGERLRLAREHKKITVAEVATQLRLTIDNVGYLEADRWDKLHGRPYAHGYVSSYVNFLGLPHNEMLALFNLEYMEYTTTLPSMDGFKHPKKNTSFPIAVILFLVIIAVSAWFAYQYWLEIPTETATAEDKVAEQFEPATPRDVFSGSIVEPLAVVADDSAPSLLEKQALDNHVPEGVAGQLTETAVAPIDPFTVAEVSEPQIALATTQSAENKLIAATGDQLINGETQTPSGSTVFVMQFEQDCWVEVTNSDDEIIVNRTMKAGDIIELTEKWPLLIVLGNATTVTATYNNETFDISPYSKGNVARFSVGDTAE